MIHHTRGVYPNGDYKDNGVRSECLAAHIRYNLIFRPGRAFFVDGILLNSGINVSDEIIAHHSGVQVKQTKDTVPYG